jgi:hypothetical protein
MTMDVNGDIRIDIVAEHKEGLILLNMNNTSSKGWVTIKLIRVGKVAKWSRRKQACLLGWSYVEQRLAKNHDTEWLQKHRPDLLIWIEHQLYNTKNNTG